MQQQQQQSLGPLLEHVDKLRTRLHAELENQQKLEQYFTSAPLAKLMASMMTYAKNEVHILDPGAGVGVLFAACVDQIHSKNKRPSKISITSYEIDDTLLPHIEKSMKIIKNMCQDIGINFSYVIKNQDFISESINIDDKKYTHIIMNPPYGKINVNSDTYDTLSTFGLPTTNMYAAFVGVACKMLADNGQIVFITPRSFCNGEYFYQFRKMLLESLYLKRIHHFKSRSSLFLDDGVLQENVIVYASKQSARSNSVMISASGGVGDTTTRRIVKRSEVIRPDDPKMFIHIVSGEDGTNISNKMNHLACTMSDLGINVSTGRVVDFRIRDDLRCSEELGETTTTVPLVRPFNILTNQTIQFPIPHKKHSIYIMVNEKSKKLLVENGNYVLVKRFTTIEQNKRITAAVWRKDHFPSSTLVGFENRINYFHHNGAGLPLSMARGLCAFLNSTCVDVYFRQFSGNTQVNASDLRYLRYPSPLQLREIGKIIQKEKYTSQEKTDSIVGKILNV